jgi:hypothetical protein
MLGEQIAEAKGKLTEQRVLDVEGPKIEYSFSAKHILSSSIYFPAHAQSVIKK